MKLFIEPLDVWLFRDGRPFNAGEDHVASSQFPPSPSVMQGVIRTLYLVQKGVSFEKYKDSDTCSARSVIGSPSDEPLPAGFLIKGPLVARSNGDVAELLWPMPADVRVQSPYAVVRPARAERIPKGFDSSLDGLAPLLPSDEGPEIPSGFLTLSGLQKYLAAKPLASSDVIPEEDIVKTDHRVGIGLEPGKKVVSEGLLYSPHFSSLRDKVGLAVEVSGVDGLAGKGLTRIGGEARGAAYREVDWQKPQEPPDLRRIITESGRFLLYLATPGLFRSTTSGEERYSSSPESWNDTGIPASAKLVGMAIGTPIAIGGWDMANNRPKPTKPGVRAGTVYFFDCEEQLTPQETGELFERRWFHALPGPHAQIGMGITLIGGWDYV